MPLTTSTGESIPTITSGVRVAELATLAENPFTPVADALNVGTQVQTAPPQFGNVMSEIKPRMAVAYYVFIVFDTLPRTLAAIRETYDGPVSVVVDCLVFNVTKDDIRVRMLVHDEDIWTLPSIAEKLPADQTDKVGFSDYISEGRVVCREVLEKIYSDANKEFGTYIRIQQ